MKFKIKYWYYRLTCVNFEKCVQATFNYKLSLCNNRKGCPIKMFDSITKAYRKACEG